MPSTKTSNFHSWIQELITDPAGAGAKGWALYILTLPTFLLCGMIALAVHPSGNYPSTLLAAPVFIVFFILITVFAFVAYKLPSVIAVPLIFTVTLAEYYYTYLIGTEVFGW